MPDASHNASTSADLRTRLADRELLVVTGKGGVGKSAVAAALARLLSSRPRTHRALVLEVDPRENLHQLLGVQPSGGDLVDAGGGLSLQNLKPTDVLDRIVIERLKLEAVARRVLDSPVYAGNLVSTSGDATALVVYFNDISDREYLRGGVHEPLSGQPGWRRRGRSGR